RITLHPAAEVPCSEYPEFIAHNAKEFGNSTAWGQELGSPKTRSTSRSNRELITTLETNCDMCHKRPLVVAIPLSRFLKDAAQNVVLNVSFKSPPNTCPCAQARVHI